MLARILGSREFTGWHMLGVLFLFFGTIISVNLTLAYFAVSSWSGLVVPNSYVASQQFNGLLAERARQATLGWTADVSESDGALRLVLTDADGAALRQARVVATFGRLTHEGEDTELTLLPEGGGIYATRHPLAPGLWSADIAVTAADGTVWTDRQRLVVAE